MYMNSLLKLGVCWQHLVFKTLAAPKLVGCLTLHGSLSSSSFCSLTPHSMWDFFPTTFHPNPLLPSLPICQMHQGRHTPVTIILFLPFQHLLWYCTFCDWAFSLRCFQCPWTFCHIPAAEPQQTFQQKLLFVLLQTQKIWSISSCRRGLKTD